MYLCETMNKHTTLQCNTINKSCQTDKRKKNSIQYNNKSCQTDKRKKIGLESNKNKHTSGFQYYCFTI